MKELLSTDPRLWAHYEPQISGESECKALVPYSNGAKTEPSQTIQK